VKSTKYMHITGYARPNDNYLEHQNVTISATSNFFSSTYGLEGNRYAGRRVIQGDTPPAPATHGLPGDIYRLSGSEKEWRCTRPGYVKIRNGQGKPVEAQWKLITEGKD